MLSKCEIRVGKIINVEEFPKARKPAYKLKVMLGSDLVKQSSAQFPPAYPDRASLLNRIMVCLVNTLERNVAGFKSQVLCLGMDDSMSRAWLVDVENAGDELIGGRVVLEGDNVDSGPVDPLEDLDAFLNLNIVKAENRDILLDGKRLGVYDISGGFHRLVAPEEAVTGTILH